MEGSNKELVDECHAGIGIYVRSYRVDGYERERAVNLSTNQDSLRISSKMEYYYSNRRFLILVVGLLAPFYVDMVRWE